MRGMSTSKRPIGIGLLGAGVVGGGVAKVLSERGAALGALAGRPLSLVGALVRDKAKSRPDGPPSELLTTDPADILESPEVDVVVEVMGGEQPALEYMLTSVAAGKHVVTANKEVMARHGPELLAEAHRRGVRVLFEASVAGGTPIIAPLTRDLAANEVTAIRAIINGTTNYILTRMAREGVDFGAALAEAQALGYAEADPSSDVEGRDAAYKLAVLSTLAFRARVGDADVHQEGISRLTARDFRYAGELGYAIKLLAIAAKEDGTVQARVHPALVPQEVMIAKVDGVLNAVEIETDLAGRVLFHGRGAGAMPTASAVVADVVDVVRSLDAEAARPPSLGLSEDVGIRPMSELETKYYLRLSVTDRPGVLASIAGVLGRSDISIASVIQKEADEAAQTAEIVLMTHRAREASMQQALRILEGLDVVVAVGNMVRVEEWDG